MVVVHGSLYPAGGAPALAVHPVTCSKVASNSGSYQWLKTGDGSATHDLMVSGMTPVILLTWVLGHGLTKSAGCSPATTTHPVTMVWVLSKTGTE